VVEAEESYTPDPVQFTAAVALGAVARRGTVHSGQARYYGPAGGVEVTEPGYAVAGTDDLQPAGGTVSSFSAAFQSLTGQPHMTAVGAAKLQVVGGHLLNL
jgi:hypothetical protein